MVLPPFDYLTHWRVCRQKQRDRGSAVQSLSGEWHSPISRNDKVLLDTSIERLSTAVRSGQIQPLEVIHAYGKRALQAHAATNCLTEILFPQAVNSAVNQDINLNGPLAGVPVSLKDSIVVAGVDTTIGYSRYANSSATEDGVLVKLLKKAGAIPIVKTNLPITLLSFESANELWGTTTNPHNRDYSPGGSTGGEAALLAFGGSRIGVGSDVAGSVRLPAHWSGCCSLRCSTGRWPKAGIRTSTAGQEGVPSVFSPMARTVEDLVYFTRSMVKMKPWTLDPSVHPLEWRDDLENHWRDKKLLKIGVLRDDGVVTPTPACARALDTIARVLQSNGHETIDVSPPSPYDGLKIASQLLCADGGATFLSHFRTFEANDPGANNISFYSSLPSFIRYLHYLWVRYVRRDTIWAGLVRHFGPKSAEENWRLVVQREEYRMQWHNWWNSQDLDVILTVPNATPALPHGAMKDAFSACGYTFLFNLLDYTAGVLPVTKVNATLDRLPPSFNLRKLNGVAWGAYKYYDADKMAGLPVGVQVVGRRLEEEKVLAIMMRITEMMASEGKAYPLLNST